MGLRFQALWAGEALLRHFLLLSYCFLTLCFFSWSFLFFSLDIIFFWQEKFYIQLSRKVVNAVLKFIGQKVFFFAFRWFSKSYYAVKSCDIFSGGTRTMAHQEQSGQVKSKGLNFQLGDVTEDSVWKKATTIYTAHSKCLPVLLYSSFFNLNVVVSI